MASFLNLRRCRCCCASSSPTTTISASPFPPRKKFSLISLFPYAFFIGSISLAVASLHSVLLMQTPIRMIWALPQPPLDLEKAHLTTPSLKKRSASTPCSTPKGFLMAPTHLTLSLKCSKQVTVKFKIPPTCDTCT